jgi:UDP-N-acetylglucosamine--N-acetylmuramyl-(pentapeptide) pyrophosphoryl-undecaprenol N-acetylglucosamine transferase
MKVLIAAGGTGGHISPGTALAEECMRRGHSVEFVSLKKNAGYPDLSGRPYPVTLHAAPPFPSSLLSLFSYPLRLLSACVQVRKSVLRADCVAGFGGYPTVPSLLLAFLARRPIFLCEQNAVPGNVTRLFARFARRVFLTLESDAFPGKGVLTGNPLRTALVEESKKSSPKNSRPVVLVLGGSQGARQINEMISSILAKSEGWTHDVDWLFQCGESHVESMKERLNLRSDVKLFGFHAGIQDLYGSADLLVSRSGAGILTEAALFGLPCVLIPLPGSRDDHQLANARVFEKAGAARVVFQKDSDPAALEALLRQLVQDRSMLGQMSAASRQLAVVDAAGKIVSEMEKALS